MTTSRAILSQKYLYTKKKLTCAIALKFLLWSAVSGAATVQVERVVFPVTLSNGFNYSVIGYYYHHGSSRERTLQLLVHGGTYDHRYWDFPTINGQAYSYAQYMAEQHYAVIALDLLGSGESDRPNGDFLTVDELANSLHQVMQHLRMGTAGVKHPVEKIVLIGHSLGSSAGIVAQATYHDADALVTTGLGHVAHDLPLTDLLPQFLLFEYFPLPPEVRALLFYFPPNADLDVIHYDTVNIIELISRGQLLSIFPVMFDPIASRTASVTGSVLVQLSENDPLFPASLATDEAACWPNATVTVQALPRVGHSVNTHYDHLTSWLKIDEWIRDTIGAS